MAEYQVKNKPDINKSMLMSLRTKKGINNVVLPLADIHLSNLVKVDLDIIVKKIVNPDIMIVITNDPLITFAQDWSNMGCFRIKMVFKKCKLLNIKNSFCFVPEEPFIETIFPQRMLYEKSKRFVVPKMKENMSFVFNKDLRNGINIYVDNQVYFINPETMYQKVE
ncbi:MAG: hypothetical protein ACOC3V_02745 [bacterium]